MARNSQNAALKLDNGGSKQSEEIHLVLPKNVTKDFQQVAKKLRMTPTELFEEMVEIYKTTV